MSDRLILRIAAAAVVIALIYQPYIWNSRPAGYSFFWSPRGLPDTGMIIAEILGILAVSLLLVFANRSK
ncbi:hypothetical protein HW452_05165 [Halomonas aquamarina]|uniref:Uncharacterized protein n=1 Tax=Vreelandella aquamarina TaxID=77097 RepID=A0ACC5VRL5_9GAMM|nr:hypothetical protein [Halomonas aquamarina]MBZ5486911.1 hypothetical protein [Halomonas aquamarina]